MSAVQEFLKKYPGRVDARAGGPGSGKKTCLQVAAHQGLRNLCVHLLDAGASFRTVDEDGDTSLHYAAFGFVINARTRLSLSMQRIQQKVCLPCAAINQK